MTLDRDVAWTKLCASGRKPHFALPARPGRALDDPHDDGGVDFLLTSAWADVAGPKTGRVFILAGPTPDEL